MPIAGLTPEGAEVAEAIKSYSQLGTNVAGINYYLPKQATEYEQGMYDKRKQLEASDLEHAVYDPAAAFVSATQVSKGAQLDNIVTEARILSFAGQIDEQGVRDAVELWRTTGGDAVIDEINALYEKSK